MRGWRRRRQGRRLAVGTERPPRAGTAGALSGPRRRGFAGQSGSGPETMASSGNVGAQVHAHLTGPGTLGLMLSECQSRAHTGPGSKTRMVRVDDVVAGSQAAKIHGLRPGLILSKVNGASIEGVPYLSLIHI